MRRNIRRHTNGDTVSSIDEQRRQHGRKNRGLLQRIVEVSAEINRVLVQIADDLHSRMRKSGLGVTHGGSRVSVDRAEVPLAIDQRIAH